MGEYTTINPNSKKERAENDVYLTPLGMARAILELLPSSFSPETILDPGCGEGHWGKAIDDKWHVRPMALDIRKADQINPKFWHHYENIETGIDYLSRNSLWPRDYEIRSYDLIIGNPPFYLAEEFIRRSFELLKPEGYVVFLLRLAYLASGKRYDGLFKEFFPKMVAVSARRPSFYFEQYGTKGTDGEEYAVFFWQKEWKEDYFVGKIFNWEY